MNHKTLPLGYHLTGTIDFTRSRKQMKIVAYSALAAVVVMVAYGLLAHPVGITLDLLGNQWYLWFALAAMLFAYIPLHELTHGICMYALSGVKPKYGLKLPYAYAGSDVYFDKNSHIITALAPVVVWGAILAVLGCVLPEGWWWLVWAVQISNISGSTGDIYCVIRLARAPGDILIRDTGTRMTVYRKVVPATEERKI